MFKKTNEQAIHWKWVVLIVHGHRHFQESCHWVATLRTTHNFKKLDHKAHVPLIALSLPNRNTVACLQVEIYLVFCTFGK